MGQITRHPYTTREEWLALRNSLEDRLGGSELGIAAGHSHYNSAYAMFCEKVHLYEPEDISQKEAIIQGHDLEGYVAERFTRLTGKAVHEELCIFTNSDAPHLKASIDRKIDNEDSGLECKTVKDIVMRKFPRGDFPQTYYDQCACYLKVTELKRWYLAMLVFGTEFKVFLMTTVKEEEERYSYLKLKIMGDEVLTDEEADEWEKHYSFLESCYYIGKEELDGCEAVAANFMSRVESFNAGNPDAWPIDEIDGSSATRHALMKVNPNAVPSSSVTFDSASEYGIQNDGNVYVGVKREDVAAIASRRGEIMKLYKGLEEEMERMDNQMTALMRDKETFNLPGWKITNKNGSPRKYANAAKIEEYFQARKERVPEGIITISEPKRSIRFWPHKAKAGK